MNEDEFVREYFSLLCKRFVPLGYDKDRLIKTFWAGTKKMTGNDGTRTNEEVFWEVFSKEYGTEKLKDKVLFDDFYLTDFKKIKAFCRENEWARKIINFVKEAELKTILASNPVFPKAGMITRLEFVGLKGEDFDYVSGYETSDYAKPNPKYFSELLSQNGLSADEVIFFGNNEKEDIEPASAAGIRSYAIGDCVIRKSPESTLQTFGYDEVERLIKNALES